MKGKKGFSFTEIMIILAIVAIVLAIGVPYFIRHRANVNLRMTTDTFKGDLDLARSMAKSEGGEVTISFEPPNSSSSSYSIINSQGRKTKVVTLKSGVTIDCSGRSGDLKFKENGSCTCSGSIVIKSSNTSKQYVITINSLTGEVKVEEK